MHPHCILFPMLSLWWTKKQVVRSVIREYLEAERESNDQKEVIDFVGGGEAGIRSDAESEGFTFVDTMRRAKLLAASELETVIDTFGMPTCAYHFLDKL